MDLILIRHPAVDVAPGMCYGQTDVPLLDDVAGSAHALTARMDALRVPGCIGEWHTSPLSRCRLIAEALGPTRSDPRLQELDFGAWEGQGWDAIDRASLDAWAEDLQHARAHGGESLAQFTRRVTQWFDDVSTRETGPVHVMTHAGVIRVLTGYLLGVEPSSAIQWPLDFAGIVWIRRVGEAWVLVRWNA
jgi:alpha-ribazole phosphatase